MDAGKSRRDLTNRHLVLLLPRLLHSMRPPCFEISHVYSYSRQLCSRKVTPETRHRSGTLRKHTGNTRKRTTWRNIVGFGMRTWSEPWKKLSGNTKKRNIGKSIVGLAMSTWPGALLQGHRKGKKTPPP